MSSSALHRAVWRDVSVPDNLITSQRSATLCPTLPPPRFLSLYTTFPPSLPFHALRRNLPNLLLQPPSSSVLRFDYAFEKKCDE